MPTSKTGSAQESDGPPNFIGILQRYAPGAPNRLGLPQLRDHQCLWASEGESARTDGAHLKRQQQRPNHFTGAKSDE